MVPARREPVDPVEIRDGRVEITVLSEMPSRSRRKQFRYRAYRTRAPNTFVGTQVAAPRIQRNLGQARQRTLNLRRRKVLDQVAKTGSPRSRPPTRPPLAKAPRRPRVRLARTEIVSSIGGICSDLRSPSENASACGRYDPRLQSVAEPPPTVVFRPCPGPESGRDAR